LKRKSSKYMYWLKNKPCFVCGAQSCTPHHVRLKGLAGIGQKPPDTYTVPICYTHHYEIETQGLLTFMKKYFKLDANEVHEYFYRVLCKYMSEYILDK